MPLPLQPDCLPQFHLLESSRKAGTELDRLWGRTRYGEPGGREQGEQVFQRPRKEG